MNPPPLTEQREELVAAVQRWIGWAHETQSPIIEVRTVLPRDKTTWALNMREDDQPVVLEGTDGIERLRELDLEPDLAIEKRRDDAFHGTDLLDRLHALNVDELVIGGIVTEACIAMTAATAYAHDLKVSIADGAVTSYDEKRHTAALKWLEEQYRQEVVTPDDLS